MNRSLLYHWFGVQGYAYRSVEYKDCAATIHIEEKIDKPIRCPHCGGTHVIKYGKGFREVQSLPVGSKRSYLGIHQQRYCCKDCQKAFFNKIPFVKGNCGYTFRFSRYLIDLLGLGLTIKEVSRHLQVCWDTVKEIHERYLEQHYACPPLKDVQHIGIDEFAVAKGQIYKTIVVDVDTGHIVYVGDGKGKDALVKFWKRVKRAKANIETVSSDLSAAYIASVRENAPNAIHVYDHFHVVKLVNEAVDAVRRQTYNKETDNEMRKVIKGNRWLLLYKDKSKWKDDMHERLKTILEMNKPIATAYYLKEDVDYIWKSGTKQEADRYLEQWCKTAEESELSPFVKVATTLRRHKQGILAWYDHKTSNAIVEGINNKIKVMKRKAYGYRDQRYFDLRLLGLHDRTNSNVG